MEVPFMFKGQRPTDEGEREVKVRRDQAHKSLPQKTCKLTLAKRATAIDELPVAHAIRCVWKRCNCFGWRSVSLALLHMMGHEGEGESAFQRSSERRGNLCRFFSRLCELREIRRLIF